MKRLKPGEPLTEGLIRLAHKHAENVLLNSPPSTSLTPVFAVFANGKIDIFATPWSDDTEKRMAQLLVRARIRLDNAEAYSFVSEAWMLSVDKSEYPNAAEYDGIRPSQSDKRVEVVSAIAVAKSEVGLDKLFHTWKIERDGKGSIVKLVPMPSPYQGSDNVGGAMAALMDDM
jgi:hypothetical protein